MYLLLGIAITALLVVWVGVLAWAIADEWGLLVLAGLVAVGWYIRDNR